MSSATALTCSTMISPGNRVHGGDRHGVLRGDRGDRGHPVDATASERLEVGLDAGAAAGVGAGDREDARWAVGGHGERRIGRRSVVTLAPPRVGRPRSSDAHECSPPWPPSRSRASAPRRSRSRSTSGAGLPTFTLVGLPDRAIRESRERVRAALLNSGLDFPQKRLTVNLAPAHVRKAGPELRPRDRRRGARGQRAGAAGGARGVRARGRAVAERRAAAGARSAERRARRPPRGLPAAPRARAERAGGGARRGHRGHARSRRSRGWPTCSTAAGRRSRRAPAVPDPAEPPPESAGPRRRARPGGREASARDRGGRRPQRADGRAAGRRARRCSPAGCPGSCRRRASRRRSRSRRCTARPASAPAGSPPSARSARRTTRSRRRASWAAAAGRCPARSRSRTAACCSWTSCPEFARSAVDALRQPLEEGRVEITRGQRTLDFPANAIVVAACNRCPCARPPDRCACTTRRARALPAPPERAARGPDRPRLPGGAVPARGARRPGPTTRRASHPRRCAPASWRPAGASSSAWRAPACSATATWTDGSHAARSPLEADARRPPAGGARAGSR